MLDALSVTVPVIYDFYRFVRFVMKCHFLYSAGLLLVSPSLIFMVSFSHHCAN